MTEHSEPRRWTQKMLGGRLVNWREDRVTEADVAAVGQWLFKFVAELKLAEPIAIRDCEEDARSLLSTIFKEPS